MDARGGGGCVIVVVFFLCSLLIGKSEGRTKSKDFEIFFNNDDSLDITDEMWEQIQSYCRLDVMQTTRSVEAFGLYLKEDRFPGSKAMDSKVHTMEKVNLSNVINALPLHSKQTLLDCLQKESVPFRVSGEGGGSKNWYIKYLESFFSWSNVSRRYLDEKLLQSRSTASAPAFSPAPLLPVQSPIYTLEPSFDMALATYFEPNPEPPAEVLRTPFPPDNYSSQKLSPRVHASPSPQFAPYLPSNKHHIHIPVAAAIGMTAAGAFVFAVVLFRCYHKRNNTHSGYVERDDGPLLTLSFGDFYYGSSRKSTLGGTDDKEKFERLSSFTDPNQNGKLSFSNRKLSMVSDMSSLDGASSLGEAAGAARLSEELSALSSKIGAPVLPSPPLKPPPGRTNLSGPPPSTTGSIPGPPPPPISASSTPGPPPPPTPAGKAPGPPPPPPPKGAVPPRQPQPFASNSKLAPLRTNQPGNNTATNKGSSAEVGSECPKSKLKPFFWDKVLANPDQSMVWHQISTGSFQFDEEMIENLFGYTANNKNKNENKKGSLQEPSHQYIQILDYKKAQNISILLRALNVTIEEVRDALHEGNELPTELLETLLKMAPTAEEELKLRLYSGNISLLGHAERFLKVLVDIPFAFKRMDSLLFRNSLQEEISSVKESLATLEVASRELRNSRLFLKLLEAVLKTGNRMNDGTFRGGAQAFKLDTLLKLADVKGADGKTTLLHFVVQEIIRSEGKRAARGVSEGLDIPSLMSPDLVKDASQETESYYRSLGLQVVSGLGDEMENVRKAAALDADIITSTVSKLGHGLLRTKSFLNADMTSIDENSEFHRMLKNFVMEAEVEITRLLEEEKRIMSLVKSAVDYFHGSAGKDEGLRLFVIVRDFLVMLDKACKEVRKSTKMVSRVQTSRTSSPAADTDLRQRLFPAIIDRRIDDNSSDDETSSL